MEFRFKGAKSITATTKQMDVVLRKDYNRVTVNAGFIYAKQIAPKDTGALQNAIQRVNQKQVGRVRVVQPNNKDGRNRPYHMWFHGLKAPSRKGGKGYDLRTGKYAPKSGISDFMDKTYLYLQRISSTQLEQDINKI